MDSRGSEELGESNEAGTRSMTSQEMSARSADAVCECPMLQLMVGVHDGRRPAGHDAQGRRQLDLPADRPKPRAPAHVFERPAPPPQQPPPQASLPAAPRPGAGGAVGTEQ